MKSRPMNFGKNAVDQVKKNKSFEFVKFYRSTAETTEIQPKTTKWSKKVKNDNKTELDTEKYHQSSNRHNKKKTNDTSDLPNVEAVESNTSETTRSSRKRNLTFTPNKDEFSDSGVKSIMKNKSVVIESVLSDSNVSTRSSKPKKRNKSVSFMLEDAEEVVMKKSKSNDLRKENNDNKEMSNSAKTREHKKNIQSKESENVDKGCIKISMKEKVTNDTLSKDKTREPTFDVQNNDIRKKRKKAKKTNVRSEDVKISEDNVTREQSLESKIKKLKKKKHEAKSTSEGNPETEDEPARKTLKKDLKPEAIARGLESLNIGDNAHTLTNLLDEMTVVDKNKKKKNRQNLKRNKMMNSDTSTKVQENIDKDTEKLKWFKRKWNKDTKVNGKARLLTSVVVEDLPIKIMCGYKTLLSEHFGKCGTIAGIGVAEAYPTEDTKPVFTTTIYFQEEEAATKALEEDNTVVAGRRVRVRRPLPPAATTLVVHAYSLSEQALSTLFSGAGRIRAIRQLVKGKKSMPTAFVEFDGPETVERALKMAEDIKINGKKLHVAKYEDRKNNKPAHTGKSQGDDSAAQ